MTITYEWKIDSVKVKDQVNQDGDSLTDVVCQIKWAKHGVDEDGNAGSVQFVCDVRTAGC